MPVGQGRSRIISAEGNQAPERERGCTREVACGRGWAEDNHADVAPERVRSGGGCPPPLDNRATRTSGQRGARLPTAPTGPTSTMRDLVFLKRIPNRHEDARISSPGDAELSRPVVMWRGSQRRSAARRLRPREHGATANVPAGTVAMDHGPTRPPGLADTADRRLHPRGRGATADVPAGTAGPTGLLGRRCAQKTKSLIVAVGPVGAVGKRAPWLA